MAVQLAIARSSTVQAAQPNENEQLMLENQQLRTQVQNLNAQVQALNDRVDTVVASRIQGMLQQATQQIRANAEQQVQQAVQQAVDNALAAQQGTIVALQNRVNQLRDQNAVLADRQDIDDGTECCAGTIFGCVGGILSTIWCIVKCCLPCGD